MHNTLEPSALWAKSIDDSCRCIYYISQMKKCLTFFLSYITKTYLYNFDPLKPHFYIVKRGFTGVYIIFVFLLKNIDCGYSLELPRRGGSNEYPHSMFLSRNMKNIRIFYLKKLPFFGGKIFHIFERRVFVMFP